MRRRRRALTQTAASPDSKRRHAINALVCIRWLSLDFCVRFSFKAAFKRPLCLASGSRGSRVRTSRVSAWRGTVTSVLSTPLPARNQGVCGPLDGRIPRRNSGSPPAPGHDVGHPANDHPF